MTIQQEKIPPSQLKWIKLEKEAIDEFRNLYFDVFPTNEKYPSFDEIIEGLNSKYLIMIIKNFNKIIGLCNYCESWTC